MCYPTSSWRLRVGVQTFRRLLPSNSRARHARRTTNTSVACRAAMRFCTDSALSHMQGTDMRPIAALGEYRIQSLPHLFVMRSPSASDVHMEPRSGVDHSVLVCIDSQDASLWCMEIRCHCASRVCLISHIPRDRVGRWVRWYLDVVISTKGTSVDLSVERAARFPTALVTADTSLKLPRN